MDFINGLFGFITDRTQKITHKALTIFSLLLLIYLFDNLMGFSYYSNIDNKIEVVEKINSVLKDSTLLDQDKKLLINIRSSTIIRASIKDKTWHYLTDFSSGDTKSGNDKLTKTDQNNQVYQILSSAWFFIIVILLAPFIKHNETSFIKRITTTVLIILFAGIVGLAFNKLLWLLPVINGNINYNYLLNALVNLSLMVFMIKIGNKN